MQIAIKNNEPWWKITIEISSSSFKMKYNNKLVDKLEYSMRRDNKC
jgi:hypothetical protein